MSDGVFIPASWCGIEYLLLIELSEEQKLTDSPTVYIPDTTTRPQLHVANKLALTQVKQLPHPASSSNVTTLGEHALESTAPLSSDALISAVCAKVRLGG
jgi:hypothetical protein